VAVRTVGGLLALYGVVTLLVALQRYQSPPPDMTPADYFARAALPTNIAFGAGLALLGLGVALRGEWTRGTVWMVCVALAFLVPSALLKLLGGQSVGSAMASEVVVPIGQVAFLAIAALLLNRYPLPGASLVSGLAVQRPRVTFLSRGLGVLLALAGLTRLWLASVLGPETLTRLWEVRSFDPFGSISLFNAVVSSAGLGIATLITAFGISLRRPWGMQLGLPLSFAGLLVDLRGAASLSRFNMGPQDLDWVILHYASAILYALVFLYCFTQLLRGRQPAPVQPQAAIHSPPETRATIADDANWRASLLASLKSAGVQPAPKGAFTGVILPILGIVVLGGGWALLTLLIQLNPPTGSDGPNLAVTILMIVVLSAISILLIQRLVGFFARRFWRFRARSAEQELERGVARRPVLYLRSFALDEETARPSAGELVLGTTPTASAEQMLAKVLNRRVGPVIAIGMPGEKLPGLGAARFYASHEVWHQKVADAAQVSQLVVWTTGSTEGLRWEIAHLLKSVPPAKLIVWAHPHLLRVGKAERAQEWSTFLATLGKAFPKALPERLGKTRLIWFKKDWEPVPVAPRWGFFGALFRVFRDAQTVALKQMLRQKSTQAQA
jgi:hypothetical protein